MCPIYVQLDWNLVIMQVMVKTQFQDPRDSLHGSGRMRTRIVMHHLKMATNLFCKGTKIGSRIISMVCLWTCCIVANGFTLLDCLHILVPIVSGANPNWNSSINRKRTQSSHFHRRSKDVWTWDRHGLDVKWTYIGIKWKICDSVSGLYVQMLSIQGCLCGILCAVWV